jgi:hypothetical protein
MNSQSDWNQLVIEIRRNILNIIFSPIECCQPTAAREKDVTKRKKQQILRRKPTKQARKKKHKSKSLPLLGT